MRTLEEVLEAHVSLGTSGRYICEYGVTPESLANAIRAWAVSDEVVERAAQAVCDDFFWMQGGDPSWPQAPELNAGDMSIARAALGAAFGERVEDA